jgi:hypothetical protein
MFEKRKKEKRKISRRIKLLPDYPYLKPFAVI